MLLVSADDRPNQTGHRKLYNGVKGRTHADILDFGVGSDPDDEDVAEWLDEIERRFGDMRAFKVRIKLF